MKEFRVIDAAPSEEQLRLRLKPNELEDYGEAFTPDFVYEVIRQLSRFRDMQVSLLFAQTDRVMIYSLCILLARPPAGCSRISGIPSGGNARRMRSSCEKREHDKTCGFNNC